MRDKIFLTAVFIVSFWLIFLTSNNKISAASCSWTGGGIDNNWSTAQNWDGGCSGIGGVPDNGDDLNIPANEDTNNDISNLTLNSLHYTGANGGGVLTGNDISVTGAVTSEDAPSILEVQIIVSGAITISSNEYNGGFDVNGGVIEISPTLGDLEIASNITGSGTLNISFMSYEVHLIGGGVGFSGNINVTASTLMLDGAGWDLDTTVHLSQNGVFTGKGGGVTEVTTDGSLSNIIVPSDQSFQNPTPEIMNVGSFSLQNSNDQIRLFLAGTNSNQYDQIHAVGSAIFPDATFYLFQNDGFYPTIGTTFTIITANVMFGTFHGLPDGAIINLGKKARYQIHYGGTEVTLTVVSGYCTWTGAVNNLWSNGGNWTPGCSGPGGIPDHGDELTFSGSSNINTINDIGDLNIYGMDFLSPGFSIDGGELRMFNDLLATEQATINSDIYMVTPNMGAHNYGGTLEVDDQTGVINFDVTRNIEVSGSFAGCYPSMHVIFDGPHVVTLSGNNNGFYCMDIATEGLGNLRVNGDYADLRFIVRGGSILTGDGNLGSITGLNGNINPGFNLGLMEVLGDVTLNNNSAFLAEINGPNSVTDYDLLESSGTVNLGGANLIINLGYTPNAGDSFIIITATGGITGEFDGLPNGSMIIVGGTPFIINYSANSVDLTVASVGLSNPIFTSDPTTPFANQPFTITSFWLGLGPTATGTAELFSGSTSLGTVTLVNGVATFNIAGLPLGTYSLTVEYSGDVNFSPRISDPLELTVVAPLANTGVNIPTTLVVFSLVLSGFGIYIIKKNYEK